MKPIEHMGARLTVVTELLTAQLSTRHIKRELKYFADQDDAEILKGILMIVSAGEGGYKNMLRERYKKMQ